MTLLSGKVVVITGSSRGIGRGCALECAKQGAKGLVLHYFGDDVTTEEVKILQSEIAEQGKTECIAVPGDIAEQETSQKVHIRVFRMILIGC